MDALSSFLRLVRIEGSLFSRAELSAPWGVLTDGMPDAIFHVVLAGGGWVCAVDDRGHRGEATSYRAGDLIVFPHGHGHIMGDRPSSQAVNLSNMAWEEGDDGLPVVRQSGGGPATSLLCGTFRFDDLCKEFLLPLLPTKMVVTGGSTRTAEWLDTTLRVIADEQASQRPGAEIMVSRLADVLFVQVLRTWITDVRQTQAGWLGALSDPQMARALGLMHHEPAHPWTAATLAQRAGMSRSAFFARFSDIVGESPSAYLTRWRMQLARGELTQREEGLAQIAARVGYGSEASFSRAFKKQVGVSPSVWRQQAQTVAASAASG